jgi:Kdo2-lipid IVA lauroyltransferase/acyltransferase
LPIRVGVARANVRRVFGTSLSDEQQKTLVRQCLRQQGMAAVEMLRMPLLTPALSRHFVEQRDFQHLYGAFERGKGVIVVTAHFGNIDMLACSQAAVGLPINGITKAIGWKPANDFLRVVRQRTGIVLLPTRGSRDLIRAALASNELVAFAFDQHMARHRAIVCDFCGQLASTSPQPVRFAFETGAPIVPVVAFRKGESEYHVARAEPFELETPHESLEANIRHNTERLNRVVERWLREHPEQWLWLHRRWKVQDDPAGWEIPQHLTHLLGARQ